MSWFVDPFGWRVLKVDVAPTGDGLFVASALFRGREVFVSEAVSRQRALLLFRCLCGAAGDCGFWPLPLLLLFLSGVFVSLMAFFVWVLLLWGC